MTKTRILIEDLRKGDRVIIAAANGMPIGGWVEDVAPHLDAAWIREDDLAARRLITTTDLQPTLNPSDHETPALRYQR
jgi:hypothetical protein